MVAIMQEKQKFIGSTEIEESVDRVEKMKRGMFMVESSYYARGSNKRSVFIICACGERTYIEREERSLEGLDKLDYSCTSCPNDTFLSQRSYVSSFAHFRNKEKMFQLAVAGFYYKFTELGLWNNEHRLDNEPKIGITAMPVKIVVSTNKSSGVTYQIQPDKQNIRTISRIGIIGEHERGLMTNAFKNEEHKEALLTWYKELYEQFPSYLMKEWRLPESEIDNCSTLFFRSHKLFLLYAYPYLRLLGSDIYFPFVRREERAMAKMAKKKIDVYRIAVPSISKSTLLLLENPEYVNAFNHIEIIGMIQNKDILRQAISSYHNSDYYSLDEKYIQLKVDGTHFTRSIKKAFIKRFFKENIQFDKRVVMKNNPSGTISNIYKVHDSLMIYERIKREMKELSSEKKQQIDDFLSFSPKESVRSLHDRLSTILGMIERENKEITYTDAEISKWNKAYNSINFRLIKDTHEMIKVGQQMDICVGGYDEGALAKEFLIIIGYVNEQPFVCIEVRKDKVVQIKKKYNELLSLLDGEKTKEIRRYIKETKAKLDTYDFHYELEELPMNLREHRNRFGENQQIFNRENPIMAPVDHLGGIPYGDPFANYHHHPVDISDDDLPF